MGKAGEKQTRRPKIKDKCQSERFKKTARQLGADKSGDAFDRIIEQMARPRSPTKTGGKYRYRVRRQSDGNWCVWDTKTDKPAETPHGVRHVNLRQDEAIEEAEALNNPQD
jgi:hypothetical protein